MIQIQCTKSEQDHLIRCLTNLRSGCLFSFADCDGRDSCEDCLRTRIAWTVQMPRWTADDIEAARCIRWLMPSADHIGWDDGVKAVRTYGGKTLMALPPEFFEGLGKEETVLVDDIIREARDAG